MFNSLNPATLKLRLKTTCHTGSCWSSQPWYHRGVNSTYFEEKSDMGASVGVGGLIVGISMLVVFSMAYQSITMQIDSGLERIENADDPLPTFTLDDAELWEGAVVDISITGGGGAMPAPL